MDTLPKYRRFLGKEVDVVVDRPIGSKHPKYGTTYESNYGYVLGTLAGDGMEIDAYILGIDQPIETYRGLCIAVLRRKDDIEHKLVVANAPMTVSDIHASTNFIEQYFETEIEVLDA